MDAPSEICEGTVLWINPEDLHRVGCPNGFPFKVVKFAGRGDNDRFWVRGEVLDPSTGWPVDDLMITVPPNQRHAFRSGHALRERRADDPDPVVARPHPLLSR